MTPEDIQLCIVAGRIGPLLEATVAARGVSVRRYLLGRCEEALRLADPGSISEAVRTQALELGLPIAAGAGAPSHAVLVPFEAMGIGLVRTLFVTFRPHTPEDDGSVDDAMRVSRSSQAAVRRALQLAAVHEGRGDASGHLLTAAQPAAFRGVRIRGASLGAATYVSAMSLWTRRAVLPGVVVTGALQGSSMRSVGKLAAKLDGVRGAPFEGLKLVVPAPDRDALPAKVEGVEIIGVADTDALLEATLSELPPPAPRHDELVYDALRAFNSGWQGWRWAGMRAQLEELLVTLPARRIDLHVQVLAMLGAAVRHLGDPDESMRILDRGTRLAESPEGRAGVPDAPLVWLERQRAMTLRQLGVFETARDAASNAVRISQEARMRDQLIWSHGTAGLVATSLSDPEAAIEHQRSALRIALDHAPASAPRSAAYLVEALGRAGRLDEARQAFAEGLDLISRHVDGRSALSKMVWLRISFASALLEAEQHAEALEALNQPNVRDAILAQPMPGLLGRRLLGAALVALGDLEAGYALLAASPSAYGRLLNGHNAFVAQQNVLHEVVLRAYHDRLSRDAVARAHIAIEGLPQYEAATRLLGPIAREALEALHTEPADAHASQARRLAIDGSVRRLLRACERLG